MRNICHLMAAAKLLFHDLGGGSIVFVFLYPLLLLCLLCCIDPLLPCSTLLVLVNIVLELIDALLYVLSSLSFSWCDLFEQVKYTMMIVITTPKASILASTMDTISTTLLPSPSGSGVVRTVGVLGVSLGCFSMLQVMPSYLLLHTHTCPLHSPFGLHCSQSNSHPPPALGISNSRHLEQTVSLVFVHCLSTLVVHTVQSLHIPLVKYCSSPHEGTIEHTVSVVLEHCCSTIAFGAQTVQFTQVLFLKYCPSPHDAIASRHRTNNNIDRAANFDFRLNII